jgi:hypothetical protein
LHFYSLYPIESFCLIQTMDSLETNLIRKEGTNNIKRLLGKQ